MIYACDISLLDPSDKQAAYAIVQKRDQLELVASGWLELQDGDTNEGEAAALLLACELADIEATIVTDLVFPKTALLRLSPRNACQHRYAKSIQQCIREKQLTLAHPTSNKAYDDVYRVAHAKAGHILRQRRKEYTAHNSIKILLQGLGLTEEQLIQIQERLKGHLKPLSKRKIDAHNKYHERK